MRRIDTASGTAGTNASPPELKELVTEATRALARLDVARLEELALSCQALTRMPSPKTEEEREEFAQRARAARGEMAIFARVLEATRANLKVMDRLRELRMGSSKYGERRESGCNLCLKEPEGEYGND